MQSFIGIWTIYLALKTRHVWHIFLTRLPASRSSSVGPEGCFSFCHPQIKGGGSVIWQKWKPWSRNAFQVIWSLFSLCSFFTHTTLILSRGGVVICQKWPWSTNAFYVILSHFNKCCSEQSNSKNAKFPPLKSFLVVLGWWWWPVWL